MTDQKHTKEQLKYIDSVDGNAHQSGVKIIEDLCKQRDELREALVKIQDSIPACMNGDFIIEHFDGEGNYCGTEQVNPVYIVGGIVEICDQYLTKTKGAV